MNKLAIRLSPAKNAGQVHPQGVRRGCKGLKPQQHTQAGYRYASFTLKQLPLDQLKLGRSFVHDIASDGNVALLVQSIIDLSGKYRITVIAEGVESEAQLTSLKERDCVAYQGFPFSKAVSILEFEQLLDRVCSLENPQ